MCIANITVTANNFTSPCLRGYEIKLVCFQNYIYGILWRLSADEFNFMINLWNGEDTQIYESPLNMNQKFWLDIMMLVCCLCYLSLSPSRVHLHFLYTFTHKNKQTNIQTKVHSCSSITKCPLRFQCIDSKPQALLCSRRRANHNPMFAPSSTYYGDKGVLATHIVTSSLESYYILF